MSEMELKTNPVITKQVEQKETEKRLQKQINRCERLEGICSALTALTIAGAAIGDAIVGFEGAAKVALAAGIVCSPMIMAKYLLRHREGKLENKLDDIKQNKHVAPQKSFNVDKGIDR